MIITCETHVRTPVIPITNLLIEFHLLEASSSLYDEALVLSVQDKGLGFSVQV